MSIENMRTYQQRVNNLWITRISLWIAIISAFLLWIKKIKICKKITLTIANLQLELCIFL